MLPGPTIYEKHLQNTVRHASPKRMSIYYPAETGLWSAFDEHDNDDQCSDGFAGTGYCVIALPLLCFQSWSLFLRYNSYRQPWQTCFGDGVI